MDKDLLSKYACWHGDLNIYIFAKVEQPGRPAMGI